MRIPSGSVDRIIYFVAVDITDLKTRETGLSSFTVYRSRNGGVATIYTTPTIAELSAGNMPGVYGLTIDEDTTIGATHDTEEYCLHITQASMAPVTRVLELYRPEGTEGNTILVDAAGNGNSNVTEWLGTTPATPTVAGVPEVDVTHFNGVAGTFSAGRPEVNTTHAAGTAWNSGAIGASTLAADTITDAKVAADVTIASVTGNVGGNVTGTVASVVGAVGSVTGNVGGNVTGTIGGLTVGALADMFDTNSGTTYGAAVAGSVVKEIADNAGGGTPPTAAQIADAVWDEAQVDHVAVGSFGIIASEIADILVDTAEIGAAGAGLTVLSTQASVNTIDDFLDTELAAIKAVTDVIPNAGALTTIQADLDDIQTRLPAALVSGRIDASVGAMAAGVVTAAAVATGAIDADALAADAVTEIGTGVVTAGVLTENAFMAVSYP